MHTSAIATPLEGVLVIEVQAHRDERGFFLEFYHRARFESLGIRYDFVQDNHSLSGAGVVRGLHYQDRRAPMGKLVRCTRGAIFDVAVDLRVGSPTFGQWHGVDLTADNMRQLFIPPGFAHGFATLAPQAEVQYKCTGYYTPEAEGVLAWNDPEVGIRWPIAEPTLSHRDRNGPSLRQYLEQPAFHYAEMAGFGPSRQP
jgi:dTDP-4-dehydrorhamnose 3,5-epimerase